MTMSGSGLALIIEWHPGAIKDLTALGKSDQQRIRKVLNELAALDDARQRLAPYSGALKGYWKLRVGDLRLVCEIEDRGGQRVLIIHLAHRCVVYGRRGLRTVDKRGDH
jgi:mRNA interferase RelE/StbE